MPRKIFSMATCAVASWATNRRNCDAAFSMTRTNSSPHTWRVTLFRMTHAVSAANATGSFAPSHTAPLFTSGSSFRPMESSRFLIVTPSFCIGVVAAAAEPPNSRLTSARITPCALAICPCLTNVLICSFCCAVNVTPTRCRAVIPLSGSFSAFPSWIEEAFSPSVVTSPLFSEAVMSTTARDAWLNMSLPLPVSFLMLVKVRSRFSPVWIASSSTPTLSLIAVARSPTWPAVTCAAPPVDLIAAVVCAVVFTDSVASLLTALNPATRATPAAAHPRLARPRLARSFPDALTDVVPKARIFRSERSAVSPISFTRRRLESKPGPERSLEVTTISTSFWPATVVHLPPQRLDPHHANQLGVLGQQRGRQAAEPLTQAQDHLRLAQLAWLDDRGSIGSDATRD